MTKLVIFTTIFITLIYGVTCQDLAQCLNNGTPLNGTTCQCPAYVAGNLCETVKCQRWGIPDKNRCACAPGWYDKYCGIRGCRPENEDNLNINKRSFIVVFNTKTTMADQLKTLRDNFGHMINSTKYSWNDGKTENWIENFILYGFVSKNGQLTTQVILSDTVEKMMNALGTLKLQDGDAQQPVLEALKNVQQTTSFMKAHSIVLVFTDSPASDATPWSHRFEDRNLEQLCLQISFLWRSKVSFFVSIPNGSDTTIDGIDVYKRLAKTNHGDAFFVKNTSETASILISVIGAYYFPENIGVGYNVINDRTIVPIRDNKNDVVFLLITIDPNQANGFPTIDTDSLNLVSSSQSHMLYMSRDIDTITIRSPSQLMYNFRVYLQSKNTLLFDYNSDMMIDVGNGIVHLGVDMHSTIRTFGFPQFDNMTYRVTTPDNVLVRGDYIAYKRPQLDCTFEYAFPPWTNTNDCIPGPVTQVHTLNYQNGFKTRVSPGYCDQIAHYTHQQQGYVVPQIETLSQQTENDLILPHCPVKNIDAINDPRLSVANQYVFILEQHSSNKAVYQTLVKEINDIVKLVETSTNTTYKKEFTLIIHDDKVSRVVLSHYNADIFARKLIDIVNNLILIDNLDGSLGLLSIVQAQKMNIMPTSQVYYFTNQAMKNVNNMTTRTWDIVNRDIEFNFITIADGITTEIFALPWQLELVQKMSNGRIIPISNNETTLVNIFADMMTMNALTTDNEKYNCFAQPYTLNAFVESRATSTVIQIVGTGIQIQSITDAAGKVVSTANYVHFKNNNFISFKIDVSQYTPGWWIVSVQTSRGGCQITVRHQTTYVGLIGFTNSTIVDVVASQIPTQRIGTDPSPQILAAVYFSAENHENLNYKIEIQQINRKRYDMPISYQDVSLSARDSSCVYRYITPYLSVPKNELTLWIMTGYDNNNNLLARRLFYYYQHYPVDQSVCHGGQVDIYGQCICPERYTGEYCWDRICAPGATLSYGICSCSSGFMGDFCEIELMMPNATDTTTPTIQTTTSSSYKTLGIISIITYIIISLSI